MILWMSELPSRANPVNGLGTEAAWWWFPPSAFPRGVPQESPAWPPCPCLERLDRQHPAQRERVIDWNSVFQRISHRRQLLCGEPHQGRGAAQVQMDCQSLRVESEELGQNQNSLNFSTVPNSPVMTAISTSHLHPLQSYKQVLSTL